MSTETADTAFDPPADTIESASHHALAAAQNAAVAEEASGQLLAALSGDIELERILLKAAAGAGKSYVLKRMVESAIDHPQCLRVAVISFQNRQIWPLAAELGEKLGGDTVCLFSSQGRYEDVPDEVHKHASVAVTATQIHEDARVILATSHKLGGWGERSRLLKHLGIGFNGDAPFDVLFVDEAWQLANHLFEGVKKLAPITVGVGDVGQLPPLEIGTNPWSGDPRYNPYRAWPTGFDEDDQTWSSELPAVWRPPAAQLPLWRAFYPEWAALDCVAAPGDRPMTVGGRERPSTAIWNEVAASRPVLLEVDGLDEAEAPDVDLPLVGYVEGLLDDLFASKLTLGHVVYDDAGSPTDEIEEFSPGDGRGDQLVTVLATRNQAVDDATEAVERIREKHGLSEHDLRASTVDSWQGQTNGITVAIHPLTGASQLDSFNSAFGRLAVTCTRATHGLLVVSRPGLDEFLATAPARPGTPFGEPGNRHLPRQTHQRILATFTRGRVTVANGR